MPLITVINFSTVLGFPTVGKQLFLLQMSAKKYKAKPTKKKPQSSLIAKMTEVSICFTENTFC